MYYELVLRATALIFLFFEVIVFFALLIDEGLTVHGDDDRLHWNIFGRRFLVWTGLFIIVCVFFAIVACAVVFLLGL